MTSQLNLRNHSFCGLRQSQRTLLQSNYFALIAFRAAISRSCAMQQRTDLWAASGAKLAANQGSFATLSRHSLCRAFVALCSDSSWQTSAVCAVRLRVARTRVRVLVAFSPLQVKQIRKHPSNKRNKRRRRGKLCEESFPVFQQTSNKFRVAQNAHTRTQFTFKQRTKKKTKLKTRRKLQA